MVVCLLQTQNANVSCSESGIRVCAHTHAYVYFGLTSYESKKPAMTNLLEQQLGIP